MPEGPSMPLPRESVTTEPRTASEIYRRFKGIPPTARLTLAQKTERRKVAGRLEALADQGRIRRSTRKIVTQAGDIVDRVEFSLFPEAGSGDEVVG